MEIICARSGQQYLSRQ